MLPHDPLSTCPACRGDSSSPGEPWWVTPAASRPSSPPPLPADLGTGEPRRGLHPVLAASGAGALLIVGCMVAALALPRQDESAPDSPEEELAQQVEPIEPAPAPPPVARLVETPPAAPALERLHAPTEEKPVEVALPAPPPPVKPAAAAVVEKPRQAERKIVVKRRIDRSED